MARWVDFTLLQFGLGYAIAFTMHSPARALWYGLVDRRLLWIADVVLMGGVLAIEAGIFALFRTTPGKALLGVRVLTIGGDAITPAEYLRRQVGVHWHGLGAGLALPGLAAAIKQFRQTRRGGAARYDAGRFHVTAEKLTRPRLVAASVVVAILTSFYVILVAERPDLVRLIGRGSTWTNDVTGRTVAVLPGWKYERIENEQKQIVHGFTGLGTGVIVLFANEPVDESLALEGYVNVLAAALRERTDLALPGEGVVVNNLPAIKVMGEVVEDGDQSVVVTVVRKDELVWRVILSGDAGRDPQTAEALELQKRLFASIE